MKTKDINVLRDVVNHYLKRSSEASLKGYDEPFGSDAEKRCNADADLNLHTANVVLEAITELTRATETS